MNFKDISILVPYKPDNGHRDRIWSWVKRRYELLMPEAEICLGHHEVEDITDFSVGGISLVPRIHFESIGGFDEGFKGWGGEDDAFQLAMDKICGPHGRAHCNVWHLWHPYAIINQQQYQANYDRYCSYFASTNNKTSMDRLIHDDDSKIFHEDKKITISLCMIVKNEEDVIARCLDSVADIIDEIIIVDTGSIDKTKKIVKNYTSKIYDFEWIDDFSAARNYSFSKATNDYILWLDADDVILEEDRVKLKELKNTLNSGIDVVMMKYNVGFDIDGKVNFSYYRERLVKRNNNPQWHDPVHEHLDIRGTIINTNICITHDKIHAAVPGRNLKIYEKMLAEGKELSPRSLYYYSRELYYNANYDEAIAYYNKFLDSGKGWFEDCITACYDLSICYNHKGDQGNRLKTLLRSFAYDTPRAEICCGLGYYYIEKQDYNRAIFWFDLATKLEKPEENWGFSIHDCWDYLPNIQLCICYDKLGYIEKAIKHNDRAGEIKPGDPFFLYNKTYFDSLQENNK